MKPKNIFIDSYANAYLGDLDVSMDAATRCSTTTATVRYGGTTGYMAPELERTGSTMQTDIFAFGRLLLTPNMLEACVRCLSPHMIHGGYTTCYV